VTHAENDFLQLGSDVGLVGAGLLLMIFIYFLYKAVSGIRSLSQKDPQKYIGIGGLVGILALMFHSLVERNIQVPANAFLCTFIWALVLTISSNPSPSSTSSSEESREETPLSPLPWRERVRSCPVLDTGVRGK
jgi:O-antigen ligase